MDMITTARASDDEAIGHLVSRSAERHTSLLGSIAYRLGIEFDDVHRVLGVTHASANRFMAGEAPLPLDLLKRLEPFRASAMRIGNHVSAAFDAADHAHVFGAASAMADVKAMRDQLVLPLWDLNQLDDRRDEASLVVLMRLGVSELAASLTGCWRDHTTLFGGLLRVANVSRKEACDALRMTMGDLRSAIRGKTDPTDVEFEGALALAADAYGRAKHACSGGDAMDEAEPADLAFAWVYGMETTYGIEFRDDLVRK